MKEQDLGIVVATVVSSERVLGASRLHKIVVDIGGGQTLVIASGVAGDLADGFLVGKQVPIQVGLPETRIRGIVSQARFLATSGEDGVPVLLHPHRPVVAGARVW